MPTKRRKTRANMALRLTTTFLIATAGLSLITQARAQEVPALLSATGLYEDIGAKVLNAAVMPFEPQYPLWSDGAEKNRWLFLPAGTRIDTSKMDRWEFPVGTKFWKEFSQLGRRVETRLMEKIADGADINSWRFAAFRWDEAELEAVNVLPAGFRDAAPTQFPGVTHDIPRGFECSYCHAQGGDPVLGFDALQMSTDLDRENPLGKPRKVDSVTLETLVARQLLTVNPEQQPRIEAPTLARAAAGYFHGNCGGCHNPLGQASFTGMFLRHEIVPSAVAPVPALATTVNVLTADFEVPGRTLGLDSYRVEGGSAATSAVHYRMNRRDSDRMPPVGSKVTDAGAIALIEGWIAALTPPD